MSSAALTLRQIRYENLSFWRNPPAAFFTFVFPLLFLFIFNTVFGEDRTTLFGQRVNMSQFYVPAIAAFSIINTCFTGLAISMSFSRDQGLLKRVRGTPLPAWSFLCGRITHLVFVAVVLVAVVSIAGRFIYDVELPTSGAPEFTLAFVVGALAFGSLAFATTAIIPNPEAAPAVVNAVILPLLFISDVFFGPDQSPEWLQKVANVFPVRPFTQSMVGAFNENLGPTPFEFGDIVVVAVWGVVGLFLAIRFFSWEPRQ